jgi:hypothetical protein
MLQLFLMESRFLPGFDHLAPNGRLITMPELPEHPRAFRRDGKRVEISPRQQQILGRFRQIATNVGMIGPEVWHSVPPVSNWDALTVSVSGLYCDAMRRNMIAAADPLPVEDTRLVFRDAYAGTAQTVAFLQVVAEVAALRERRYPAAGLRRIAQRSKGFILHHAAHGLLGVTYDRARGNLGYDR